MSSEQEGENAVIICKNQNTRSMYCSYNYGSSKNRVDIFVCKRKVLTAWRLVLSSATDWPRSCSKYEVELGILQAVQARVTRSHCGVWSISGMAGTGDATLVPNRASVWIT